MKRRTASYRCLAPLLAMALAFAVTTAAAAKPVPPHLAAMAAGVVNVALEDLKARSGDAGRAWAAKRALEAIDEAGIQHWAARDVRLDGLAQIAAVLKLDIKDPQQESLLRRLLAAGTPEEVDKLLADILKTRNEAFSDDRLALLRQAYRAALIELRKGLETRFELAPAEGHDRITLEWNPSQNEFHVRHEDSGDEWNAPVMTLLRGAVVAKPQEDGRTVALAVAPADEPVTAYSAADLRHLSTAIFGEWLDARGNVWRISSQTPQRAEPPQRESGPTPAEKVKDKQHEIDRILASKAYVWRNPDSGEETRQERFRRLKEPWIYLGEQFGEENAKQRMATLEAEIAELSKEARKPLVEQYDPIGFTEAPAQPVTVRVKEAGGYTYNYDEARFDGRRVLARRTLRDRRDITDLPAGVITQLIASWSPPEWIELETAIDPASGKTIVDGLWWRLHVTYSSSFGMAGDVQSIHTPWNRPLTLQKDERRAP